MDSVVIGVAIGIYIAGTVVCFALISQLAEWDSPTEWIYNICFGLLWPILSLLAYLVGWISSLLYISRRNIYREKHPPPDSQ